MKKAKKSKKNGKKKKEKIPFVSKYAPVDYEQLMMIPKVKLTIKLNNIKSESSLFEANIPENSTVARIKEIINEKHGGSCNNIRMYLDSSDKTKSLEGLNNKSLNEIGLTGEINIFYEFDPIKHPLLEM